MESSGKDEDKGCKKEIVMGTICGTLGPDKNIVRNPKN